MPKIPGSTYRLQLHKDFTFDDAAAIAEYLKQLGITHVYSSPYLQAAPGSMHGYDVVDHRAVNEELGGREGHERFSKRLGEVGLGQVLDIVPNHMSLAEQNRYWWDVLENGNYSRYANFFDIDWNSNEERLRDKVLVPILPDQYGHVLTDGGMVIVRRDNRFAIEAAGRSLPVAPESLPLILLRTAFAIRNDTLNFITASYGRLTALDVEDRRAVLARHRDKTVLDGLLDQLCRDDARICPAIDRAIAEINANADALDEFLSAQHYRLAYWKTSDQQLGYRRFFDVNTLIGLRVEREYVFEETHALILEWLRTGVLDGVRVDHPDGLRDPRQYFERLRTLAPEAWIVGEKILEPGENLRSEWPVEGTTGYDFLNVALGVLVNRAGLKRLGEAYTAFTGDDTSFPVTAHDKKLAVTQEALGSDVNRLASLFVAVCENNRNYRDFSRAEIRRVIREVAACFAVYRTYVVPERHEATGEDCVRIERAIECAKSRRADIDPLLFDFMRDVLQGKVSGRDEAEFVCRFQQFTSPVMAKGVEDTAFYCWNRLVAMNEVGGDPDCDGFDLQTFHDYQQRMHRSFPATMTTLSTHDTKRSDDVRARLAVLTEITDRWAEVVRQWREQTASYRHELVDAGTEWFLFQTLVGAWPLTQERITEYMLKAMREAKVRTSWVGNHSDYEKALSDYITALFADKNFAASLGAFVDEIREPGRLNSLTQTLLKHTVPGVPDLYQGGELWDLSLVDPDNRRPVDYASRRKLLGELCGMSTSQILARMDDGLPKLHIIHQCLLLRNEQPEWFGADAAYLPLQATGTHAERIIAYQRGENVVSVAPRWTAGTDEWSGTTLSLPAGRWKERFTGSEVSGGVIPVSELLKQFPVALLTRMN